MGGVSYPRTPDAEPRDKRDPPINRDDLAMVSTDPAEGTVEPWRIEGSGFDTRPCQHRPDTASREIQRATPVTEDPDSNAVPRALRQCLCELEPDRISVNRVALEVDRAPR